MQKETKQKSHTTQILKESLHNLTVTKAGFLRNKKTILTGKLKNALQPRATMATHMMKKRGAYVVQVPKQREETAPKLVIPNLQREKSN